VTSPDQLSFESYDAGSSLVTLRKPLSWDVDALAPSFTLIVVIYSNWLTTSPSGNLQVTGVNLLELERLTWSWSTYMRLTWSWSSYLRLPYHLVYLDPDTYTWNQTVNLLRKGDHTV
jgi:hypothetical protein